VKKWETIADIPLSAWFRFKTRPNNLHPIQQISLQYAGTPMPGLALKAGPAVNIDGQWWRPQEMESVFEVSLDCEHWTACTGEIGGGADVDRLASFVDKGLNQARLAFDEQRTRIDGLQKQIDELLKSANEAKTAAGKKT